MVFSMRTPMLGRPAIVRPAGTAALPGGMSLQLTVPAGGPVSPAALDVSDLAARAALPWRGRLALRPVGSTELVPLIVAVAKAEKQVVNVPGLPVDPTVVKIDLEIRPAADSPLTTRTLYDLVFRIGPETRMLAAHSVYARRTWDGFGVIHATDLHVSGRVDGFRKTLRATGSADREHGARRMVNPNDSVRALINYANKLHARGEVDLILATGDLVDYVYEDGQDRRGPGNFGMLERLILGRAPGQDPESPPNNELHVPIFTIPGNHDYVTNSYGVYFKIDIPVTTDVVIRKYDGFNLGVDDAIALVGGKRPTVSQDTALAMTVSDRESAHYYLERINDRLSYSVNLGAQHRLVMLDTGPNKDVVDGTIDALQVHFGQANEDETQFSRGMPTTKGVSDSALAMLKQEIDGVPPDGVLIVGVHTPPLNPWDAEYPHYFRESERPLLPAARLHNRVLGHIARVTRGVLGGTEENPTLSDNTHPTIIRTPEPHFARGELGDLLDFGIGRGNGNELLQLLSRQEVDVTLCGHVHEQVEFRLRGDRYFTDYYTETPREARVSYDWFVHKGDSIADFSVVGDTRPIHVFTRADARVGQAAKEVREPHGATKIVYRRLEVPPFPKPLSQSADAVAWWREHGPLVLLTSCLGPTDHSQRDRILDDGMVARPHVRLQGIRLLHVEGPVIRSVQWVGIDDIHAGITPQVQATS